MDQANRKSGVQVQSVARALEIVRCFQEAPQLGISEIAAAMDLSKSTVFGLVNTLLSYGYLDQVPGSKKYRLGTALLEWGDLVLSRIDIRNEAKGLCASLAAAYHTNVHIATFVDGEVIYLDKINRGDFLISSSAVGKRVPMYCTGVGKAMLAFLPEEYLDRYVFGEPLEKMTPHTITDRETLLLQLAEIHRTRIAFDREEAEEGLSCIASPVLQRDGLPQIAVSLSFPYGKIREIDPDKAMKDVLDCTVKLSVRLGYRG